MGSPNRNPSPPTSNPTPPGLRDRLSSYALAFAELNAASRAGKVPRTTSQRALLAYLGSEEAAGRMPVGFTRVYRGYYRACGVLALAVGVGVGYAGWQWFGQAGGAEGAGGMAEKADERGAESRVEKRH